MNRHHLITAAVLAASIAVTAGCASASSTAPPVTAASTIPGVSTAPAPAPAPVLRPGKSVTFADPVTTGTQGAVTPERETWTLTSVHDISYAAAMAGTADTDVPANLGAAPLRPGDRYLVLGLTITAGGPDGFTNTDWTLSSASYSWSQADGNTGSTADYCLGQAPSGSQADPQYISDMCVINALNPGQRISGYLLFEVPAAPSAVAVYGPQSGAPLVVVDPDEVCRAASARC